MNGIDPWPLPRFKYEVTLGHQQIATSFHKIQGLQVVSAGAQQPLRSVIVSAGETGGKSPASDGTTVLMSRAIFQQDQLLEELLTQVGSEVPVRVQLLDDKGDPVITWVLVDCVLAGIYFADLDASANEVAEYTLEFSCSSIDVSVE